MCKRTKLFLLLVTLLFVCKMGVGYFVSAVQNYEQWSPLHKIALQTTARQ